MRQDKLVRRDAGNCGQQVSRAAEVKPTGGRRRRRRSPLLLRVPPGTPAWPDAVRHFHIPAASFTRPSHLWRAVPEGAIAPTVQPLLLRVLEMCLLRCLVARRSEATRRVKQTAMTPQKTATNRTLPWVPSREPT